MFEDFSDEDLEEIVGNQEYIERNLEAIRTLRQRDDLQDPISQVSLDVLSTRFQSKLLALQMSMTDRYAGQF